MQRRLIGSLKSVQVQPLAVPPRLAATRHGIRLINVLSSVIPTRNQTLVLDAGLNAVIPVSLVVSLCLPNCWR